MPYAPRYQGPTGVKGGKCSCLLSTVRTFQSYNHHNSFSGRVVTRFCSLLSSALNSLSSAYVGPVPSCPAFLSVLPTRVWPRPCSENQPFHPLTLEKHPPDTTEPQPTLAPLNHACLAVYKICPQSAIRDSRNYLFYNSPDLFSDLSLSNLDNTAYVLLDSLQNSNSQRDSFNSPPNPSLDSPGAL